MKVKKNILSKFLISFILSILMTILVQNIYAYEIKNIVRTKDELYDGAAPASFPTMVYKKQVAAYADTITKYKNGWNNKFSGANNSNAYNVSSDGWVYGTNSPQDNLVNSTYTHNNPRSFSRVYEYFHRYQNSVYDHSTSKGNTTKYYATGELWPQTYIIGISMIPKVVYDVTGENTASDSIAGTYTGVFWQPAYQGLSTGTIADASLNLDLGTITNRANEPIVMLNSNSYRFAVTTSKNVTNGVHDIFISDNAFTDETIRKLWNTFGTNDGNKTLTVYGSSINRTSSKNAKNGEQYWKHMDTAYKFWETTVRGYNGNVTDLNGKSFRVRDWAGAPAITGGASASSSVINYYDNTFVIPKGNSKKIYVRHIDVTGLSDFRSTDINNSMVITGINNGQIIEIEQYENSGKLQFSQYRWPSGAREQVHGSQKFNEVYELNLDTKNWVVGNIKYTNSSSYVNSSGNSITLSYLNNSNGATYTEAEEKVLNNYNCVGGAVGYGDSLDNAIIAKDNNINTAKFAGGDWANVYVNGADTINDYVVIDFYYEKKPTDIYVRHIDITNETNITDRYLDNFMQTNAGRAFKLNKSDWNYTIGNITASRNIKPAKSAYTYQEHYTKNAGDVLRIANIKYDHNTAGSYWDLLSNYQRNTTYKEYTCIGAAVGKADSVDWAEVNKAQVKTNNSVNTKADFVNLKSENAIKLDNMSIEKNSDYTSIVVNNNDYNVVVIDFYYIKDPVPPPRYGRQVYVRHIDITGKTINNTNVEKAIAEGRVLTGTGKAQRLDNNRYINKLSSVPKGYQELFEMSAGIDLKVSKDTNVDYNCIGSNITASTVSITDAKSKMSSRLSSGTYSSSGTYKEYRKTTDVTNANTIILIDFYYRSKHTGTPIDRPIKGRLGFYTLNSANALMLSGDNSTSSNINNPTTSDSATVYDVIPSGESLKMSIDNAYVYMLGGINIKEYKVKDTYSFNYTVTQNYKVNYLDWYGTCSSHGIQTESISSTSSSYYCYTPVYVRTDCTTSCNSEGSCTTTCVDIYEPCGNRLSLKTRDVSTTGSISRTYTYQIPYEYTFYKVKNMRLYNISRIELLDGYNNKGLPLFDGETHEVTPTTTYTNSFIKSNSTFTQSQNSQSPNRTSDTLNTTLVYYHDNQSGDVTTTTASATAKSSINTMFNNITHSMAAEMKDFTVSASSYASGKVTNYNYTGISKNTLHSRLYMKFYVKNDEVSFVDKVKSRTIKLVGEGTDLASRAKSSGDSSNEKNAVKFVDLVEYTKNKTRLGSGTTYTYTVNEATDNIGISTQYPKSIRGTSTNAKGSKYLPTSYLTNKDYYNEVPFNIPSTRLNGKRYSYGKIYYNLLENGNNELNFDADDKGVVTCTDSNKSNCHNFNNDTGRKAATGGGTQSFVDTEMYNTKGVTNPEKTTLISPSTLGEVEMDYGRNNNGTSNDADIVNVFTPISFKEWIVTGQAEASNKQVDHTTQNSNNEAIQIQKNSRFTIAMEPTSQNAEYDDTALNTDKYLMQYYIKFDFDVQDIKIYDARSTSGRNYDSSSVTAGTWIGPIYNQYGSTNLSGAARVSAFALADPNQATIESIVNQETNNYTIRAVAYNAPYSLIYDVERGSPTLDYLVNRTYNKFTNSNTNDSRYNKYYDQKNIEARSDYISEVSRETENLSRVYDFKITDLKDIDWKDIFRKSTTTTTNVHTSNAYYSGIKKWNVYTTLSNQLLNRDASEIGSTKQQILPLGPYKNTNTTYVKAPKLGYKFSFDLKTTGAIDTDSSGTLKANKKVVITPSFYYISKDPDPANHSKPKIEKEIELYYKNSSNKYVSIDNYNLYFVPDDGYRLTFEGTDAAYRFSNSSLSKSTIKLGTAKEITLTSQMMEQADNMFVQIWYGEYKLPNSTIAVKKGGDINEDRLTDGYIGVKFDIKVIEYKSKNMVDTNIKRILNYNRKDGNASGNNTTQWDYEGYLGYDFSKKNGTNITATDNIRLALEGMSWRLDQSDYEFIRGTVILYDTDAKASSDYD